MEAEGKQDQETFQNLIQNILNDNRAARQKVNFTSFLEIENFHSFS